jgi:hypothetical protein
MGVDIEKLAEQDINNSSATPPPLPEELVMKTYLLSKLSESCHTREEVRGTVEKLRQLAVEGRVRIVLENDRPITASFMDGFLAEIVRSGLYQNVSLEIQSPRHRRRFEALSSNSPRYVADENSDGLQVFPRP